MRLVVGGAGWLALYLGVALAPLVFATIGITEPGRGFWTEFSVALGFLGVALMGLQFALVARFRSVAAPFGTDALVQFHRGIGITGLALVFVHVGLSADWAKVLDPFSGETPWRVRFGALAALSLTAVVVTSLWRKRLRLSYERWHLLHAILAVVAVVAALAHILLVDFYIDSAWKRALWVLMSLAFVSLLLWVRVGKPMLLRRRPWVVDRVTPERGRATTLTLRPAGHEGFAFEPGQFGWFAIGKSPFSLTKHPFSMASSAEDRSSLTVTVKALGDFTSRIAEITPGTKVYVDGPHGVFSVDRFEGPGFCFVAGGVGITPVMSMLRTLADRGDRRPLVLFLGARDREAITFREELEELTDRLDLTFVPVLEAPAPPWDGERGFITADVLRRHLPTRLDRLQYFVCGPDPMMDALEAALVTLGVPADRIHTERFGWV